MIDRRTFMAKSAIAILTVPLAADSQEVAKVARIGYLTTDVAAGGRNREAFLQGLRDLGYIEGRNLLIESRDAERKPERLPALAAELVVLKVDVIVASGGTAGALAAKQATTALPIVFTGVGDPVADGLVTSLAQPGGNVTGLSLVLPELVGKSLELLKEAVPGVSRVALLFKPDAAPSRTMKRFLKEADVAAQALGVRLQVVEARGPADFERAFSDMSKARAGAVIVLATPVFTSARRHLVDLAAKNRLATVFSLRTSSRPAASRPMGRTLLICRGAPRPTWTRFSRVPSPAICPWSSRRSSSWLSISRPPRRWG